MQLDLRTRGSRALFRWLHARAIWISVILASGQLETTVSAWPSDFVLPPDFEIAEVAPDRMVHDAFCMCLDSLGRPVVSGPGYIRTLVDSNRDGVYDKTITHSNPPKEGAQGLWFENDSLFWVADGGLWQAKDSSSDGVPDGKAIKVLSVPTGHEHDTHAIRRGPDGYWYLMAGNLAKGIDQLKNDAASPVPMPRAGTLWRISPDFKTRSVWAHGIRNAYDFDFLPNGQIVTFDSDGERDITLPWYRPTRVILLGPGCDAGWVGEAWRDPDTRVTMPTVLASLGRGSPTGVAVYGHHAFPSKYRNAVFVLDWTFGRLIALYPESVQTDASDSTKLELRLGAETFLEPQGTVGFAPTDICVAPDGSLLVCVGGRGTRGAVYRIRYVGSTPMSPPGSFQQVPRSTQQVSVATPSLSDIDLQSLESLAQAPCPLEAWSQQKWRSASAQLGAVKLATIVSGKVHSATSQAVSVEARQNAWLALVFSGQPLPTSLIDAMLEDPDPTIQRLAWTSIGRVPIAAQAKDLQRWQEIDFTSGKSRSVDPWDSWLGFPVIRAQLECFGLRRWEAPDVIPAAGASFLQANSIRQVSLWSQSRQPDSPARAGKAKMPVNPRAKLLFDVAPKRIDAASMDELGKIVSAKKLEENQQQYLEAITTIHAALGDPRHRAPPQQNSPDPSVFDGYVATFFDQAPIDVRNSWSKWLIGMAKRSISKGWPEAQIEAMRGVAMLRPDYVEAIDYCLEQITNESHPTSDIHVLCVIGCCSAKRSDSISKRTADALLALHQKVRSRGLNTDNHWQPRLKQLTTALLKADDRLAPSMIGHQDFGAAEHLLFVESFPKNLVESARKKFRDQLALLPVKNWTTSQIRYVAANNSDSNWLALLRQAVGEPALRATVVELLSNNPQPDDYSILLSCIASSDRAAWTPAVRGLKKLAVLKPEQELEAMASMLVRADSGSATSPMSELKADLVQRLNLLLKDQPSAALPRDTNWKSWSPFFKKRMSAESFSRVEMLRQQPGAWAQAVEKSSDKSGDASRGRLLFEQAKCSQCHGAGSALGPDLSGVSKRFSRIDMFTAIYEPNRDVSDRYRPMKVLTIEGKVVLGMSIYDSADGVTLQTADGTLIRINQDDIEQKMKSTESIMPAGLLDNFRDQQLADLYAYLQTL